MAEPDPVPQEPKTSYRLSEAEKAHTRGWQHTPLRGKRPYRKGWSSEAPPDIDTVIAWARAGNVGIRTGQASGLVVIDDDTEDGSAARTLDLSETVTVLTGAGRKHHYFRMPDGARIGNSASKLAPNVDVKADGGAIVAVGSIHPETGRSYEWADGLSPDDVPIAELPGSIAALLASPKKSRTKPKEIPKDSNDYRSLTSYARTALERHADSLHSAPEGTRNDVLNRASFVLGRFIGSGLLDRTEVEAALRDAAFAAGLEEAEVHATIHSGIEPGSRDPHDLKVLLRKVKRAEARAGLNDLLLQPAPDARNRPIILVEGGKLPEIVDASELALLKDGSEQLYQRESLLVRMTRASNAQLGDGIRRPAGSLILISIEPAYLVERFTRAASFQKLDGRTGEYRLLDCPEKVAATYLARRGHWRAPVLRGVVEAPTLRPDGSILQTPGYDLATGLFFDPGSTQFALVPEFPTQDDAMEALAVLLDLLKGFPFLELTDRSVALSAILTGLVRRSIRTAPLFAFRAPKMGSGKSLLADIVGLFATGRTVPAMPQGKDEEEDRKRMLAILIEGEIVACIDNIEHPLQSPALCSILTQETWKDRILGRTGTATAPTSMTWLATGNNLVIAGDLTTRSLVCDLDPKVEHPEEREFDINLYEYIPEHRGLLVPAALTILRAYHLAGRPKQNLPVFGRFEGWSNLVRSALVWCGEADPCATRKRIEYVDPIRQQIQSVLLSWIALIGSQVVTSAEALSIFRQEAVERSGILQVMEEAVTQGEGELNALRFGNWLSKHERRIEAGLRIDRAGDRQRTALWKVTRV